MATSRLPRSRDLICVYRLLGECRDLGMDSWQWRGHLALGLRRLLGAYVCVAGEIDGFLTGNPSIVQLFSLGWEDSKAERHWERFVAEEPAESDPVFNGLVGRLRAPAALVTRRRQELVRDARYYRSVHFNEYRRPLRIDHCMYSYLRLPRLGDDVLHVVELHRASKDRSFLERDATILHFLQGELAPLIAGPLASAREPSISSLSPRLREVLQCLLEGDSENQASRRLGIAQSTVHEYVTALYRRFQVSSRGELLSRWVRCNAKQLP